MTKTEKLRNACEAAAVTLAKINKEEYNDLQSKLEFCVGSYDHDKNPSGLYEYGKVAFEKLTDFKAKNPRKVTKKLLTDLEKSLAS